MNTRVRTALQTMRASAAPKHDKEVEREKKAEMAASKAAAEPSLRQSGRERKIALQQDVDKLKKKLRHEENVHRALERAFTRPLGALPRLPPYLPSHTLELLAEVAVLEEEVVRLEEQVVNFRQGLYQEAVYISSSKKSKEASSDSHSDISPVQNCKSFEQSKPCSQSADENALLTSKPTPSMRWSTDADNNSPSWNRFSNAKPTSKKSASCSMFSEDRRGKENQSSIYPMKNARQPLPIKKVPMNKMSSSTEKQLDAQAECLELNKVRAGGSFCSTSETAGVTSDANKLSEDILRCLVSIFSRMDLPKNNGEMEASSSGSSSCESSEEMCLQDPYGISSEYGIRDIGPYKNFLVVDANSVNLNLVTRSPFLMRRLKLLLKKLVSANLSGLTHQQKLAFWINIYNSCLMNAFLEQGIPADPQMVMALMTKAMINVGGHLLSAMTIEHFILRLPYHSKQMNPKGLKGDDMTTRGIFGLDWPEPLVTFALSCGSWSSPAVRVYTASQVEKELETAKRDYLQASVGIAVLNKLAIPKLLDWYLLDFAKDVDSLMDWICLQLPSESRNDAVKCLEMDRTNLFPQPIQVIPYEFRFRYLLAP